MSIMKGKLRRSAVVVAFSLGAFQALSVVGANVASAVAFACSFTGGVLTVEFHGAGHTVSQDALGRILLDGAATSTIAGTGCAAALDATIANTTAINVNGTPGATLANDAVSINMLDAGGVTADWGTINWVVNLGDNTALPPGDTLTVTNAGNADAAVDTDWGANGIDLDSDGDLDVAVVSVETAFDIAGTLGDDINAGGTTITGAAYPTGITITGGIGDNTLTGGAGNDTITGGAGDDSIAGGLGNDSLDGGANTVDGDTVDFSASTTAVTVDLTANTATGEGFDAVTTFENVTGSPQGDNLRGTATANYITPGLGDDIVNGVGACDVPALSDTVDTSTSDEDETVDLAAGTATGGDGSDTLSNVENVQAGDGNDTLTGDDCQNALMGGGGNDLLDPGADDDADDSLDGESGIDTVDYSTYAESVTVDVGTVAGCSGDLSDECDDLVPAGTATNENAILSAFDDVFNGSSFNNIVWPNGGQNVLNGCGPVATAACGIDTLNYSQGYTAGVFINLAGGGSTGGGQDSITGFQNAVGTAFNDTMIGTDVVAGTNGANLLVGGKGNDNISANAGPDFVRAGAGNDRVRGGSGDDTLMGQGGKDSIRGGQGDDDIFGGKGKDFCVGGAGHDLIKTCERPRHHHQGPNGPGVAHAARLSAIKP